MPRSTFAAAALILLAAMAPLPAQSQPQDAASSFPSKPILIIVPQTPGSAGDIYSRLYSQKIGESAGWRMIVENRPGGGTTIGVNFVAKSVPDGHTLLNTSTTLLANPVVYKNAPDPIKEFQAVSILSRAASMLLMQTNMPIKNIQEYVAYGKKNPGKINYGTSGVGSIIHLNGIWLHRLLGMEVTFVPYKGSGDIFNAMMAGEVHTTLGAMTVNLPLVKAGKARSLGISSFERNPVVPDMVPLSDQGAPGFEYDAWTGIVAPRAVPTPVIRKLNAEFVKAGNTPDVLKRLAPSGQTRGGSTIEEYQAILVRETKRWKTLAKDAKLQLQDAAD